MYQRDVWSELRSGGRGRPPRAIALLLVLLTAGAVLDAFEELHPALQTLRLSTDVWTAGEVWRVVTYGVVGTGGISVWPAFELLAVYWFAMELVVWRGAKATRNLILGGIVASALAATGAQWLSDLVGGPGCGWAPYWMMQGQSVVLAIVMAAFATNARWTRVSHTTLLFGLSIPSRWLVPIQLLLALGGFASTRDLGGLVGIVVATAWGMRMGRPRTLRH